MGQLQRAPDVAQGKVPQLLVGLGAVGAWLTECMASPARAPAGLIRTHDRPASSWLSRVLSSDASHTNPIDVANGSS